MTNSVQNSYEPHDCRHEQRLAGGLVTLHNWVKCAQTHCTGSGSPVLSRTSGNFLKTVSLAVSSCFPGVTEILEYWLITPPPHTHTPVPCQTSCKLSTFLYFKKTHSHKVFAWDRAGFATSQAYYNTSALSLSLSFPCIFPRSGCSLWPRSQTSWSVISFLSLPPLPHALEKSSYKTIIP